MRISRIVTSIITLALTSSLALAGGETAFTYQGRLLDEGHPVNGLFDFRFGLFSTESGGVPIGAVAPDKTSVTDGLFTVQIDFGADAFDNTERWLEITVSEITLSPRQPITRAPYAIQTRGMFIGDDGNILFHSLNEVEGTVTISSIGGIDLILDADTNNIGEDQNARIVMMQDGGQVVGRMGYREGANQLEIMQEFDSDLILGTNNEDRLTIDPDGNVGIGTTAPDYPLEVVSDGVVFTIRAQNNAITGTAFGVWGETYSTEGTGVTGTALATSGTARGVWGQTGSPNGIGVYGYAWNNLEMSIGVCAFSSSVDGYDFFAAGTGMDYGSTSSIRWKSNVRNIDQPLEKVARLRGVYYTWDKDHGGHHDLGMIAEEVGEVLPEIVQYEENGIDAHGMDYSKLTPLLVEAINELRGEVEHQDSQITELQARVIALETLVDRLVLDRNGGAK